MSSYPNPSYPNRLNVVYMTPDAPDYSYGLYNLWPIGTTIYNSGLWAPGTSNYVSAASGQLTQERSPTSDDSESGTWSGGSPGTRWQIADNFVFTNPPEDTTNPPSTWLQHGITAGDICFGFSPFSVPAGRSIYALNFYFRAKEPAAGANHWHPRLKIGGVYYKIDDSWVTVNPGTNWYWSIRNVTKNPATGSLWTAAEVNSIQAFGLQADDADPVFYIGAAMIQVVYSDPSTDPGDGSQWVELSWHVDTQSAWPNGYPTYGDYSSDNLFNVIYAAFVPYPDAERLYYIYPSPDEKIWYDVQMVSDQGKSIQVGDIIWPEVYWNTVSSIVTEVGSGWFKAAVNPAESYPVVFVGGTTYMFIRGGSWYFVEMTPWPAPPTSPITQGHVIW